MDGGEAVTGECARFCAGVMPIMNFSALSGMRDAGLINKKDRILCLGDQAASTLGWLRRQRFKAEDLTGQSATAILVNRLFDVVLVEQGEGMDLEASGQCRFLRDAMRYVRPGGRLLFCRTTDNLFDLYASGQIKTQIETCFAGDASLTIEPAWNLSSVSEVVYSIKKGGTYKPRLPVKYIDNPAEFKSACESLGSESHIGLDVETTLREPRILCTVQLATSSRVFVMDMLPIRDLAPLKVLMENTGMVKIIHNKDFEAAVLGQYGIEIRNVYDTLAESRKRNKKRDSGGNRLGEVCERELGIFLDKSYQASDWTVRPLSQEQLDYAAVDAEVLIRLYQVFVPPKPPETMELF